MEQEEDKREWKTNNNKHKNIAGPLESRILLALLLKLKGKSKATSPELKIPVKQSSSHHIGNS